MSASMRAREFATCTGSCESTSRSASISSVRISARRLESTSIPGAASREIKSASASIERADRPTHTVEAVNAATTARKAANSARDDVRTPHT